MFNGLGLNLGSVEFIKVVTTKGFVRKPQSIVKVSMLLTISGNDE